MSILHPSPVSTRQFTWIPEIRTLASEASSLPEFGRVFSDACDVGLTLVSHRTGKNVVVAVEHEVREDGDLLYWDLRPVGPDRNLDVTVRVFND